VIALDTHAWLWWAAGETERLSEGAREAIAGARLVKVSAISCWELASLVRRGRIEIGDRPVERWVSDVEATYPLEIVPVDRRTAMRAGALPDDFPGDPADRIVYATAVLEDVPLVTADRAIRAFDPARTIW